MQSLTGNSFPSSIETSAFDIRKYIEFPLYVDESGEYVWDACDGMIFETFVTDYCGNLKLTDILNGFSGKAVPYVTYDDKFVYCGGMPLLEIRAKAVLLKRCGLDEEEAEKIRKQILRWTAETLAAKNAISLV